MIGARVCLHRKHERGKHTAESKQAELATHITHRIPTHQVSHTSDFHNVAQEPKEDLHNTKLHCAITFALFKPEHRFISGRSTLKEGLFSRSDQKKEKTVPYFRFLLSRKN